MDYLLLKFAHLVGLVLLGGGLVAVFVSELRAYRTDDVRLFAEAARYTAVFYDALVVPGALVLGGSGLVLVLTLDLGFFEAPWLAAMWILFLFEVIEGNTVTRVQFARTLRRSRQAVADGNFTPEARDAARSMVGRIAHFLDLPILAVIIYCGAMRPESWGMIAVAVAAAIAVAVILSLAVPRLVRPVGVPISGA